MKFWSIITFSYLSILLFLCLIFMNQLDLASNIFFIITTISLIISWVLVMSQDGVGQVSKTAVRKFNFHLKSKGTQEYIKDDPILNPDMRKLHEVTRVQRAWVIPYAIITTLFFIISIVFGFIVSNL